MIIYGEKEVRKVFEFGVVDKFLISEGYDKVCVRVKCNNCGWEEFKIMSEGEFYVYKK